MAGQKIDVGASGSTVAENLKRLREQQKMTYAEVSRKLEAVQRSISPLAVRRMEEGARRVDVDDLVSLSVVLNVAPVTLLMPNTASKDELVSATGLADLAARELWGWIRAEEKIGRAKNAIEVIEHVQLVAPHWRSQEYIQGALKLTELSLAEMKAKRGDREDLEALLAEYRDNNGDD